MYPFRLCALAVGRSGGETPAMRTARRFHRSIPPRSTFAGFRFPADVIVLAVRWYLRFGLSYRDVEELLSERGVEVDHVTVYRWVLRFTPLLADAARPCRHAVGDRWQVDETYVKVAGQWRYVYRAIDQFGQVIDVLVSRQWDAKAARPDPGNPGQPVAGVAPEGGEVGVLRRGDAVPRSQRGGVHDLQLGDAAGGVQHADVAVVVDELEQVAVAGDDVHGHGGPLGEGGDHVVGLVLVGADRGDAEGVEHVEDDRDLVGARNWAVGAGLGVRPRITGRR
jgi:hypothetical protein